MVTTFGKCERDGLEVVVVAVHAHAGELVDLLLGEHAERARDLDVDLVADGFDTRRDLREQTLVGAAHRGDDAELGGTGLGRLLGGLDEAGNVEPRGAHRRLEQARLRAEVAVLRAAAGLEADDALDLHLGTAPAHPHLVGEREQFLETVVAEFEHLEGLRLAQSLAPFEHLLARGRQDVRSGRASEVCSMSTGA